MSKKIITKINRPYIIIMVSALLIAFIDQLFKILAGINFQKPFQIFQGFSLTYEENIGIAWSIPVPHEILIPLNIILLVAIPVYASRILDFRFRTTQIILALLVGGALGNIFDRLLRGFVIDFISIGWWPVFNLADIFLTVGVLLTIAFYGKIQRLKNK